MILISDGVSNGVVKYDDYRRGIGHTVTFICDTGYYIKDTNSLNATRECTDDFVWGTAPVCSGL